MLYADVNIREEQQVCVFWKQHFICCEKIGKGGREDTEPNDV